MHRVQTMAYVNDVPWHGLGHQLAPNQPLEVWADQAGMNWRIEASDVRFATSHFGLDIVHAFPKQKVLYRSDTKAPLSVVSSRYKVVQPAEILEFYRDLTEMGGYELETAGVLKDGKKLWALARTGQSVTLKQRDTVNGYLLLATACDGTLATTAQFTSVRVVCNNTLAIALGSGEGVVKVPHRTEFDAQAVKQQLGVAVAPWSAFEDYIKALAECRIAERAVESFLAKVFAHALSNTTEEPSPTVNEQAIKKIRALYFGHGQGAELASARGTVWGVLNSVTEYVDHHRRSHSNDHRRDAAWFGQGATLKQKAWEEALRLIA
jgi:phage/plasmid-like protein (TIGR03299 family)